mmetsp:Transcript_47447/g.143639  ORF Transcript_47447/g.143639 Transcript_47447/m.143639 type:complete len:313 (+) Transcript_47447:1-939(+)
MTLIYGLSPVSQGCFQSRHPIVFNLVVNEAVREVSSLNLHRPAREVLSLREWKAKLADLSLLLASMFVVLCLIVHNGLAMEHRCPLNFVDNLGMPVLVHVKPFVACLLGLLLVEDRDACYGRIVHEVKEDVICLVYLLFCRHQIISWRLFFVTIVRLHEGYVIPNLRVETPLWTRVIFELGLGRVLQEVKPWPRPLALKAENLDSLFLLQMMQHLFHALEVPHGRHILVDVEATDPFGVSSKSQPARTLRGVLRIPLPLVVPGTGPVVANLARPIYPRDPPREEIDHGPETLPLEVGLGGRIVVDENVIESR